LCRTCTALPFIVPKELESWIVCTLSLMFMYEYVPAGVKL